MRKKTDMELVLERHAKMLDLQEDIYPFTPTLRELQELWNLNTTSAVRRSLEYMVELDIVSFRLRGVKRYYYAKTE